MKYVFPNLARRGLCNMLFTWAQAVSHCYHHKAEMIAPIWIKIMRIGPWLRRERYKRFYGGEFTNNGYITGFRRWFLLHFQKKNIKIFSGMEGFFDPFLRDQKIIKDELYRIVSPYILSKVKNDFVESDRSVIAVHVRRGDFSKVGLATPDSWFIDAINIALQNVGENKVIIRVFTDGYPEEVMFISKAFPQHKVIVMGKAPAIQDLLMMSKATILVCSSESTFSMWAVFLGQMPSVWKEGSVVPNLYVNKSCALFV